MDEGAELYLAYLKGDKSKLAVVFAGFSHNKKRASALILVSFALVQKSASPIIPPCKKHLTKRALCEIIIS